MKRYLLGLTSLFLVLYNAFANTSKDLGDPPYYNPERIKKLVILYINLERVNSGRPALVINKKLNMAAQWHSDYMAAVETVTHIADKKGMHDVQERVTSYGERIDRYSEVLGFTYSMSAEDGKFMLKKDSTGEYTDFGKDNVWWYNETEIAMRIMKSILGDERSRSHVLNEYINSAGGGVSPGKSKNLDAWYGSFALVEKKDLPRIKLKVDFKKEVVKKKVNGKETDENVAVYNVSGFFDPKVALLIMSPSGTYRVVNYTAVNGKCSFRIDDEFRAGLADGEKIYIATYDKENDTYYPVMRIEVIE